MAPDFPTAEMELTHLLVVSDLERARSFYRDILGAEVYATLQSRGATFLTPPVESDWEIHCFFRDPDGHLLELSQAET